MKISFIFFWIGIILSFIGPWSACILRYRIKPIAVKSEGEIFFSIFTDVGLTVVEIVVWADEIVEVVKVDAEVVVVVVDIVVVVVGIVVVVVDIVVVVEGTVVLYILVVVEDMFVGRYVGLDRIFLTAKKIFQIFEAN